MSITVDVGLLSGKTATVKAGLDEEVGALKRRAQIALGVGGGRLVDSSGSVLDACAPIMCTRLQNGDLLALHINRIQVQACRLSFAAILGDGSVDQLKNVHQIQASGFAFAAVLGDGSVVTWGDAAAGGDSSAVQDQLKNVQQIQASNAAFAAILGDGSVVTWGEPRCGGDSSAVQRQLKN
ncbi:mask, partial [Symbiodinium sp. KB8]